MGLEEKRRTISSVFISVFIASAVKESLGEVRKIPGEQQFYLISLTYWVHWLLPFIFSVTLLRFVIGNLLHMREIESTSGCYTNEKETEAPPLIWSYDLFSITVEFLLFILMGMTCYSDKTTFLNALTFLFLIDIIWIIVGMPITENITKVNRRTKPYAWALLNLGGFLYLFGLRVRIISLLKIVFVIISVGVGVVFLSYTYKELKRQKKSTRLQLFLLASILIWLFFIILHTSIFPSEVYSPWGILLMSLVLTFAAIIDLAFDYYGLFKGDAKTLGHALEQ